MKIHVFLTISVVIVTISTNAVVAGGDSTDSRVDYRTELVTFVIDPCFLHIAEKNGYSGSLSDDDILDVAKVIAKGSMERMLRGAIQAVDGKSSEERHALYSDYLSRCTQANVVREKANAATRARILRSDDACSGIRKLASVSTSVANHEQCVSYSQ